ncbi:hypothetical protein OJ253_865 [Cryptosporidium canis]|uniref:Histidine acid phosphatase family protein n=1 Tax=Cryptosporidium canis TaxID=195482 RepID=A0A9D5DK86_9CRYT|nr:hypothetical protein OJ253_865 [Cryptosporidium canis]
MRGGLILILVKLALTGFAVGKQIKDGIQEESERNREAGNLLTEHESDCAKRGLCPEYFNFCADPSTFEETRRIPRVSSEGLFNSLDLIQVQSIIRHGARTPTKYHKCWEGMSQSWNCDELVTTVQAAAFDMRNRTQTLEFSKHYDIRQWENNLNGTCKMGQLILQGYEQHRINGKLLADAYFKEGSNLVTRSGLKIDSSYRDEMYIRSSDMQRTTVSAAALLTSLFEEFLGKEETFRQLQKFPLHTMDIQSDYLFANSNVENISDHLQAALSSKPYFEIVDKHQGLYQELEKRVKTPLLKDLWPGDIMDCIMTTICTGNHNKLPKAFIENNLLNRTISAIEKELSVIYTWKDSILSKSEMSRLLFDIREYIVDVILFTENRNDRLQKVGSLCSKIQDHISPSTPDFVIPLCTKYEHNSSLNSERVRIKVPKFILFSGHDTTIIPTLASLQIWDEHWPPYASTFIIEIYNKPEESADWKHYYEYFTNPNEDFIKRSFPYYIRLLYNGQVITSRLRGCLGEEVCHVASFFKQSRFAQQKYIYSKDQDATVGKSNIKIAKNGTSSSGLDHISVELLNENSFNDTNYIAWFLIGFTTCIVLLYLFKGVRFIVSILSGFNINNSLGNNNSSNNYQAL